MLTWAGYESKQSDSALYPNFVTAWHRGFKAGVWERRSNDGRNDESRTGSLEEVLLFHSMTLHVVSNILN